MSALKRFRPSIELICSHVNCVETPSTIPCAHCPLTFCLRHLVEHQIMIDNEQKRLLSCIEECRTRLKISQLNDNRYELFQQLDEWKKNLMEYVEKIKDEINVVYQECDQEFSTVKINALNDENNREMNLKEILTNLEQSLHILESSRLALIISPSNPKISIVKPNFNSSLYSSSLTNRPNLDKFISKSDIQFTLDYDSNDISHFAASIEHLLIYKSSRSIFQLFNHHGEHLIDINYDHIQYGDLNQIVWSSFTNGFLLATTKQLLKLNSSSKRFGRYIDIGFGLFKDVCTGGESIILVHNLGTSLGDVIEHYSNNHLIQRCWKSDLYPMEINMKQTMEIFQIKISGHLIAIDALFTKKILVCDIHQTMKCLFKIDTNHCTILSMSGIYNTQQWLLCVTNDQEELSEQRMFVIDALENDSQRRMREIKSDGFQANNISFFGSNHFLLIHRDTNDEQNSLLECRKLHSII